MRHIVEKIETDHNLYSHAHLLSFEEGHVQPVNKETMLCWHCVLALIALTWLPAYIEGQGEFSI